MIAAAALAGLHETMPDPDLAAACAFARRRRLGPFRRGPARQEPDAAGASSRSSRAPGSAGARPRRCCVAMRSVTAVAERVIGRRCSPLLAPNSAPDAVAGVALAHQLARTPCESGSSRASSAAMMRGRSAAGRFWLSLNLPSSRVTAISKPTMPFSIPIAT